MLLSLVGVKVPLMELLFLGTTVCEQKFHNSSKSRGHSFLHPLEYSL